MAHGTKQPLYTQLVAHLKEKIETEMEADDALPSERELIQRYGLSRTTVRLALKELERLGYIYRRHGKGSFVSDLNKKVTNLSKTYSFTEQMKTAGKNPQTKILAFEIIEANKYFARALRLSIGEKIIKIKRLRIADDQAMMVERTYLPFKKFPTLTREMVENKPLYDIFFQDFQEVIRVAEEEFYASVAHGHDSELLAIDAGAPVLNLIRTTYSIENEIIEYTLSVARGDLFRYKISHIQHT